MICMCMSRIIGSQLGPESQNMDGLLAPDAKAHRKCSQVRHTQRSAAAGLAVVSLSHDDSRLPELGKLGIGRF